MSHSTPRRIAGLVITAAVVVSACSSGTDSTATTTTTIPATTTTTEAAPTTTAAPVGAGAIELAPVMIDAKGIVSVAPVDWIESPKGWFNGAEAQLAFDSVPLWAAPDPTELGLELVDQSPVGSRSWDFYGMETGEITLVKAVTDVENMRYIVQIAAPPHLIDQYTETVGGPALEAFDLTDPGPVTSGLTAASVDVDGRSVAYATGGGGEVTVVFESGWGDGLEAWATVGDNAAELGHVFAYDRPGYGQSDNSDGPRDGAQVVEELRATLAASGHQPPYVLVGHSLGGLYMELFARTYAEDVAGLVLVDSTGVGQDAHCADTVGAAACGPSVEDQAAGAPEPYRSELLSIAATEEQVVAAGSMGPIPTVVITAAQTEGISDYDEVWVDFKREQAGALNATFVLAEDSSHYVQADQPDLVLEAIRDVVEQYHSR